MSEESRKPREIGDALAANYDRLGPMQRRVIDRLLSDTRYAVVTSAAELAMEVDVSESTVTRAAQVLGFAGFPDLQSCLRRQFVNAVSERIEASLHSLGETPAAAATRVMMEDAENVRATAEDISLEALQQAIDAIVDAPRVFVFGVRGSNGVAIMLGIGLKLLLHDARVLDLGAGDLPDQLLDLRKDDLLISISFRRVDRVSLDVVRHAADVGARTIAITDALSSPIARSAETTLITRVGPLRLMPSYASGASLVNALITGVWLKTHDTAASRLERVEDLWQRFNIHVGE